MLGCVVNKMTDQVSPKPLDNCYHSCLWKLLLLPTTALFTFLSWSVAFLCLCELFCYVCCELLQKLLKGVHAKFSWEKTLFSSSPSPPLPSFRTVSMTWTPCSTQWHIAPLFSADIQINYHCALISLLLLHCRNYVQWLWHFGSVVQHWQYGSFMQSPIDVHVVVVVVYALSEWLQPCSSDNHYYQLAVIPGLFWWCFLFLRAGAP